MTLDLRRSGEALRAAAGDLVRVWRATRYTSGAPVFPGLLDGIMEEFLERVAEALLMGKRPEDVWPSTRGIVRVVSRKRSLSLLADEWRLAGDVLQSACDALEVAPEAAEAVRRAMASAVSGIDSLATGHGPEGVLTIRQLDGFRPRGDSRSGGRP